MSTIAPSRLRCEYLVNPLGIGKKTPHVSWIVVSNERAASQTAYQVQAAATPEFLEPSLLWESGKVISNQTVQIAYQGKELLSMQRCYWRVRLWDASDAPSSWSETAYWEMGLLNASDWKAKWIEPEGEIDPKAYKPAPYVRKLFTAGKPVLKARLYITAHGVYEASLNGQAIGDQVFMPGISNYRKRLQYQVYDVTRHIDTGENCLGVILGDGWYRGQINANSNRNTFGTRLGLLAQLLIIYDDGSSEWIITDGTWKTAAGPILKSDLKDGEIYDARLELGGWNKPGFSEVDWKPVRLAEHSYDRLVASMGSPIQKVERFVPVQVIQTPSGQTVLDFGQNFAGYMRMEVSGPAGTTVKMQFGEALDENGNFTLSNLNGETGGGFIKPLLQQDEYTLKGSGVEVFEPHFTVHGFRYVWLQGYPGEVQPEAFAAYAIYSNMGEIGSFECSNPKLTQLHKNVVWSQKGNFLDVPTDCPTRERAGWTGDAQIFVHAGSLLMDDAAFYSKWIKDVASAMGKSGIVPNFVPAPDIDVEKGIMRLIEGSCGWGDAIVIIPWELYQIFGDVEVLRELYDSMKAWVEYERRLARRSHWVKWINPAFWLDSRRMARRKFIWDTKYHWGEWLEPDIPIAKVFGEIIKNVIFSQPQVATAYYEHSTRLLSKTAQLLGKTAEADEYAALADNIKAAYIEEFLTENGELAMLKDRQASYVRALAFGLHTAESKDKLVGKLVSLIHQADDHLGTGFLSTPFLLYTLSENGHLDLAYKILQQETTPSWLYSVNKGATTIWEDWEGIDENGAPHASLNHYSKGAVVSWLYEVSAGVQLHPDYPGYERFILQPQPGGGLTHLSAAYQSVRGEIRSAWRINGNSTEYTFTIPANTNAYVILPFAPGMSASIDGKSIDQFPLAGALDKQADRVSFELPAGTYTILVA